MAVSNSTCDMGSPTYQEVRWGEMITGTKAQLQSLGLGIDRAFPGEPGAKGVLDVIDPRGLPTRIEQNDVGDSYLAKVRFPWVPDAPTHRNLPADFGHGVTVRRLQCTDVFRGTHDQLVAAGIITPNQSSGKRMPAASYGAAYRCDLGIPRQPGAKSLKRMPRGVVEVNVTVHEDEFWRRFQSATLLYAEWVALVDSLERPDRLTPVTPEQRAAKLDGVFQRFMTNLVSAPSGL